MVNVAWVVLHCNRRIGARERRQLIPHVRFQVPFLGPESQLKSGFVCAGLLCSNSICLLLTKRSCHFLFVARVGLCCCFFDFAVSFLVPPDGCESAFLLFFYFAVHAVPKMGPPGGPIFGTETHFLKLYQGCRSGTFCEACCNGNRFYLYAWLTKRSCHFLFVARVGLCC